MSGSAIATTEPAAGGCPEVATAQTFAPWDDFSEYFLAPGGDFEGGASSWNLADGATTVEGNASFGATGAMSLSLPPQASATTAAMCVGVEHRTMRFFVRTSGAGVLHVDAIYAKRADKRKSVRLATIAADEAWAPSSVVPMIVNEIAPDYANALPVSLRFTARGEGTWQIDDILVDPYRRG